MPKLQRACTTLAALALLGLAGPAAALTFDVDGQNFPGQATAEVTLSYNGTDTLTITIENTADAVALTTAVITGFAFNVPAAVTGLADFSALGTLDDGAWVELFPPPGNDPGNAPGGYDFDGGAGTGNNVAGGTVSDGFGIGTTATFTFEFSGVGLDALVEADFTGETADGDAGPADFGVRFQGIPTGAGSDFAVHLVPTPSMALLFGLGLLALRMRSRG